MAEDDFSLRLSALGAVSICRALRVEYGLPAAVKWPNDVLLGGRKVAGVLVETAWMGRRWEYAVVGMGVNVRRGAVPPDALLRFPAADIESALGGPLERTPLLYEILRHFVVWADRLDTPDFLQTWEGLLAYRRQEVDIEQDGIPLATGILIGLAQDGALRIRREDGSMLRLHLGELSLRPGTEARR
jgi:BirA family biotin operon repressor/biotin-[acetyl-CoA-carboxylase] ligase